jgi:hypothetical protein
MSQQLLNQCVAQLFNASTSVRDKETSFDTVSLALSIRIEGRSLPLTYETCQRSMGQFIIAI